MTGNHEFRIPLRPLAAALVAVFGLLPQHAAATKIVSNCNDSGDGSLRAALLSASDGELIDATGLVCSTVSLQSVLIVANNSQKIDGPGSAALTIDGSAVASQYPPLFHNGNGTLEIDHVTISHGTKYLNSDTTKLGGGCISSVGSVKLVEVVVSDCSMTAGPKSRARGGAVYALADLTLTDSVVTRSAVHGASPFGYEMNTYGGGIFAKGQITLTRSTVSGNHALNGGGIYSGGNAKIYYSTIADNDAVSGGGIDCFCGLEMQASTVSGNSATFSGGLRLFTPNVAQANPSFIANSTFTGNTSGSIVGSAAMELAEPLTIYGSTIAYNAGPPGAFSGAVYSYADTLSLHGTIISDNFPGDVDASPDTVIDGANNLSPNPLATMPGDTIGACPQLEPLADRGGPTRTLGIRHTSPAVDAGSNLLTLPNDQRGSGFTRTFGGVADIGAWEWQGEPDDEVFHDGFNPFPGACQD